MTDEVGPKRRIFEKEDRVAVKGRWECEGRFNMMRMI